MRVPCVGLEQLRVCVLGTRDTRCTDELASATWVPRRIVSLASPRNLQFPSRLRFQLAVQLPSGLCTQILFPI